MNGTYLDISGYQDIRISEYQDIGVSEYHDIKMSGCQDIRISGYQGIIRIYTEIFQYQQKCNPLPVKF